MGGSVSSNLLQEEIEEIASITNFDRSQIVRLYHRFQRLDKDGYGTISTEAFLSVPELSMNPLVMRVISVFDSKVEDNVNFKQFATTLSVFHRQADPVEKMNFVFRMFDMDRDGFLTENDIAQVLQMMIGKNIISSEDMKKIAAETIKDADADGDGKISLDDFQEAFSAIPWEEKLSIDF